MHPAQQNYGVVGALYADFLVRNKATVQQVHRLPSATS